MPFPPSPGIHVGTLTAATPTPFDTANLKGQLEAINLDCTQISDQNLQSYVNFVKTHLRDGEIQSFGIKAPAGTIGIATEATAAAVSDVAEVGSVGAAIAPLVDAATGNWTTNDKAQGYANVLEVIQYPDHFMWLYANRATNGFTGTVDRPHAYSGKYPNAAAIQKLFVDVGVAASSTLVKGLDRDAMTATFNGVIQPLKDPLPANYDSGANPWLSRTVYLVENYNTSTGYADAVGVLSYAWRLQIADWRNCPCDGVDAHDTILNVVASSVLYSDPKVLCADYNNVLAQFGIDPAKAPKCAVPAP